MSGTEYLGLQGPTQFRAAGDPNVIGGVESAASCPVGNHIWDTPANRSRLPSQVSDHVSHAFAEPK